MKRKSIQKDTTDEVLRLVHRVADDARLSIGVRFEKSRDGVAFVELNTMQNLDAAEWVNIAEAAEKIGRLLSTVALHGRFQLLSEIVGETPLLSSRVFLRTNLQRWQSNPTLRRWVLEMHALDCTGC